MRATITYPSGSGVTLFEDEEQEPPRWTDVTTQCEVDQALRYVERVRITNPGEGYTVAPMLAITGGGGTPSLDAYIEIASAVVEIEITDPGKGYTKAPAVAFLGGSKIKAATAAAVIEGKITAVTLTDPGLGYAEIPAVIALSGQGAKIEATIEGYLDAVTVTNGGTGYTAAPTVTISGGGGTGAAAIVGFSKSSGVVSGSFVQTKGIGYVTAPDIVLSGGGGEGATAVATIAYQIKSLALTAGGDGYPFHPTIQFNGSALRSAAATAAIEGKVVSVTVNNAGLYRHRRNAAGTVLIDWPTVSIDGPATAAPKFSGSVVAIDPGGSLNGVTFASTEPGEELPFANKNYASIPDVTITAATGDSGTKATAVAELNWLSYHDQTATVGSGCSASLSSQACYSTDSTAVIPYFGGIIHRACRNSGERFQWRVGLNNQIPSGGVIPAQFSPIIRQTTTAGTANALQLLHASNQTFYWYDEIGGFVYVERGWSAGRADASLDNTNFNVAASERETDWFVRRSFARVPPEVTYRIAFPVQPNEATNASITPEYTQYVDRKGDSFWYLESLNIAGGGSNLFFPPGSNLRISADGNAVHEAQVFNFDFSRQAPQAQIGELAGFTVQPTVTIALAAIGSPAATFYRIATADIGSGGQTEAENGAVLISVVLNTGHWAAGPILLAGVITDGSLAAITVPAPSQQILAAATLTAISAEPNQAGSNMDRITTGRSAFKVTYDHSQPTVIARAIAPVGEQNAVFACSLVEQTDLNGDPFWEIDSTIATTPGTGFLGFNPSFVFEPAEPGITAVIPQVYPVLERQQPTMVAEPIFATGTGAVFNVVLSQKAGEFGDEYWEVASIEVVAGGSGYNNGSLSFGGDGFDTFLADKMPSASYNAEAGVIVSTTVTEPGWFYGVTGGLRRLHLFNKGRFFVRDFDVSSDPLPSVPCIGPVSQAAGWSRNKLLWQIDPFFNPPRTVLDVRVDVDEEYYSVRPDLEQMFRLDNTLFHYARRCPLPEIEVELE